MQKVDNKKDNEEKDFAHVVISWYPGHMAKTKRQIVEDLKLVDVVVEILDARIPVSSQNPDVQEYTKNKNKVIVLNKSDLADEKTSMEWVKYFKNKNIPAVVTDSNSGKGIKDVIREIQNVVKESQEKSAQKGRIGKSIRAMILGIPNVGKSSFINRISKKTSAQVGNKPGVTRQKQWIRVEDGIELMDTPGVLWPKLGSEEVAMNLAYTGTIKDEILEKTEIAYSLLKYLVNNYRANLSERYKLDSTIEDIMNSDEYQDDNDKYLAIFELIGKKRGAIVSGGRVDYEKVSNILLDEFRSGKLGNISLERPQK